MIEEYTTEEQKETRLNTCKQCENFTVDEEFTTCNKCGCSISLLISFLNEKCPMEKW